MRRAGKGGISTRDMTSLDMHLIWLGWLLCVLPFLPSTQKVVHKQIAHQELPKLHARAVRALGWYLEGMQ